MKTIEMTNEAANFLFEKTGKKVEVILCEKRQFASGKIVTAICVVANDTYHFAYGDVFYNVIEDLISKINKL